MGGWKSSGQPQEAFDHHTETRPIVRGRQPSGSPVTDWPWDRETLPGPLIELGRTFEGFLGLEWLELTDDCARVRFRIRDELKQPLGLLHGGIYSAVAETVASVATVRAVWRDGLIGSGLNNSASFLRPITAGDVHVTAHRRHHNDREWFWGHEFRDDRDRLCALVDVTIAVRAAVRRA